MPLEDTDVDQTTAGAVPDESSITPDEFRSGGEETASGVDAAPAAVDQQNPEVATQAEQAAQEWQSIREAAAAYGQQFPETIQDDRAALQYLIEQGRQQQLHAELGRRLAPQAPQIRQYLEQQNQPKAPEKQPWDEPEGFNPAFLELCEWNPGARVFTAKSPTVPQAIVDKVNEYAQWKERLDDPKVREQHISFLADQRIKGALDARFNEYREQMELREIEAQAAPFLYEKDEAGRFKVGRDGQPLLSIPGARYLALSRQVAEAGVKGARAIDEISRRLLAGEVAISRLNTQQQANTPAQRQAPRAAARPNRNVLQSLSTVERSETPGATEPLGPWSLQDQLLKAFNEESISAADIHQSMAS